MGDASPPDHGGRVIDGDVARQAWKEARTLEGLGELTARWCEGTLRYMPGDDDEPYEEKGPIREVLASINRSGFVTTTSQPGEPMDDGSAQRAAVEGYAREDTAKRMAALGLWTDLLVFAFPPGDYAWGYQVPITVEEYRPFTWLGSLQGHVEIESYVEDYSREALSEVARAWKVTIVDPQWGRGPYLWDNVLSTLEGRSPDPRFSVEPYHTDLGTNFVF